MKTWLVLSDKGLSRRKACWYCRSWDFTLIFWHFWITLCDTRDWTLVGRSKWPAAHVLKGSCKAWGEGDEMSDRDMRERWKGRRWVALLKCWPSVKKRNHGGPGAERSSSTGPPRTSWTNFRPVPRWAKRARTSHKWGSCWSWQGE